MKRLIWIMFLTALLNSCAKQEPMPEIKSAPNTAAKIDPPESMFNAKYYDHGGNDIGCDPNESVDCVILDPIEITLKEDGGLPDFVDDLFVKAYEKGELTAEITKNTQSGYDYLILKDLEGNIVAVYTNQK